MLILIYFCSVLFTKQVEREPINGQTDEEVRISSAKSRASLRNQFKNRLDETRHAIETRRTMSPVITVPQQKSVDDELIEDDDDDEDLPIPDDQKGMLPWRQKKINK